MDLLIRTMADPTSRQRGRPNWTEQKISYKEKVKKKNLVMGPRWGSTPRLTDWLTVSRNVTWTWTWKDSLGMVADEDSRDPATARETVE
jgi:hypothetical protein